MVPLDDEKVIPFPYRLQNSTVCVSYSVIAQLPFLGHSSTTLSQKFYYMPPDFSGSVQLVEHLPEEVADSRNDTALQVLVLATKNSEALYGLLFNFEMLTSGLL